SLGLTVGGEDLYYHISGRLSPLFKDPNVFGPYLGWGAVLALGFLCEDTVSRRVKLILLLILLGSAFGVMASGSRAAMGCLFGSLIVFLCLLLLTPARAQAIKLFLYLLVVGVIFYTCLSIYYLSSPESYDILLMRFNFLNLQNYDYVRFENQWDAALLAFVTPLGIGPGHYVGVSHFAESDFLTCTHNVYIKVAVENGYIGFVSFAGILFLPLFWLFKIVLLKRTGYIYLKVAIFSGLVAQGVNSIVIDSLHWRHFFVIIGCCLAEVVEAKRNRSRISHLPPRE
ncbi:MAG: hypothetical protein AAF649_01340, partial [Verrucomicrobiota bacterium]